MTRTIFIGLLGLAVLAGTAPAADAQAAQPVRTVTRSWDERSLDLPIVGASMAYVPHQATNHVVLFISGDGGWNLGVVDMARRIAPSAIVIGISYPALRNAADAEQGRGCWYPAADLERISHAAQKRLGLPQYEPPVLIGYSSGATLAYAALAPAPAVTFSGGISLGFCPDLEVARPVCAAESWRPTYDPKKHVNWLAATRMLPRDWYVLHGVQDQVCTAATTRAFVAQMPRAHYVEIGGTGHGFSRTGRWAPEFDRALASLWSATDDREAESRPRPSSLAGLDSALQSLGLPLQVRWPTTPEAFLVFFSGDGGWAALDDGLATTLADSGIGVVGLSSLRYFWQEKPAKQVVTDLGRLVSTLAETGRPVFAGGYSFGAEVIPVALRDVGVQGGLGIQGLVLVAPGESASFEIDPLDWVRTARPNAATRVAPALQALNLPTLCVAGTEETDSACVGLPSTTPFRTTRLPGTHHFGGDYQSLGAAVVQFIESVTRGSAGAQGR
jgi:type IV secretory pathway VirJ component